MGGWGEPHEPKPEVVLRQRIEHELDRLIEEAAVMEAECTNPPCAHAPGIRIAVDGVRSALNEGTT